MADTLTEEQHHARAMLMGLKYIPWASLYARADQWLNPTITPGHDAWLDADDLHELDTEERMERLISRTNESIPSVADRTINDRHRDEPNYWLGFFNDFYGEELNGKINR